MHLFPEKVSFMEFFLLLHRTRMQLDSQQPCLFALPAPFPYEPSAYGGIKYAILPSFPFSPVTLCIK